MAITFDPSKRAATLAKRNLDFRDADLVFDNLNFETEDLRKDYGERRMICFGMLQRQAGIAPSSGLGRRPDVLGSGGPKTPAAESSL